MLRRIFSREEQEARRERRRSRQRAIIAEVRQSGGDILESYNYRQTREHIQHGDMTVQRHTMDVARYSLFISQKLRIACDRDALIRGALA